MNEQKTTVFSRLFALLKPDRKEIRNIYVFAVLSGILSLGLPLGIQIIINFIQLGQISTSWFVLVGLVIIAIGFAGVLNIFQLRITENLQQRIFVRSAFEFAERIPKIKMVELVKRYAPEITNRFFDTLTIQKGLSKLLIDFTAATLQILFGLILLSFYHSFFIFIGLFLLLLLIVILRFTVKKGFASSMEESTFKYKTAHWLEEIAHARMSFKMVAESKLNLDQTNSHLHNYLSARDKHFKVLVQQYGFLIAFKVVIAMTLLIVGGILVINEQINIGQFVAAEIVILLVLASVEKLILSVEVIYDVLTAIEKIGQVTDLPLEIYSGAELQKENQSGIHIQLENINFKSEDIDGLVLENIRMEIKPNEKVAIISDSTVTSNVLFCLITGLYDFEQGNITLDGIPISNLNLSMLRRQIGTMLYQDKLISATVEGNIAFGRQEISLNDVVEIADRFHLKKYIDSCRDKYNTVINPEGHFIPKDVISNILLSRALIGSPRLLLLEDPTSGLTTVQRDLLLKNLEKVNFSTMIIASQDTEVHAICDRIIQLENGKIIFDGSTKSFVKK